MSNFFEANCWSIPSALDQYCQGLVRITNPDLIYMMGMTWQQLICESSFSGNTEYKPVLVEAALLIVLSLRKSNSSPHKTSAEWIDHLGQTNQSSIKWRLMVVDSMQFTDWIKTNHPFAHEVMLKSACMYSSGHIQLDQGAIGINNRYINQSRKLSNALEFLSAAELHFTRKSSPIAAFQLHQALEQLLSWLITKATGWEPRTHNLVQLQYHCAIHVKGFRNILDPSNPIDQTLLTILQKAYLAGRYDNSYFIGNSDFSELFIKIKKIHQLCQQSIQQTRVSS
jgi:HEPN domain-containing protein